MNRAFVFIALSLVGSLAVAEDLKSGLPVGEFPGAFNVKDITGPNQGKSLCYRCQFGARPVVTIFTRSVNAEVTGLVKAVDALVGSPKGGDNQSRAFVVVLTEDADAAEATLEKTAKANGLKNVPLTVFDSQVGPPDYKISKDADVTVLMWEKNAVKVNRAFGKGQFNADAQKKVIEDVKKFLG